MSLATSCSSLMMKIMSKRERMVGRKSMLASPLLSSQRPNTEFAAARTEQRELRVVVIPAFAMEMVCCSMASWIATLSDDLHQQHRLSLTPRPLDDYLILSNSSMQTTPPSARTMAPPSMMKFRETGSLMTLAVSPAALLPFPDVYTWDHMTSHDCHVTW